MLPTHVAGTARDEAWFADITGQLGAYFDGDLTEFDIPIRLHGTDFQRRVWSQLCDIPYGETISYGELARRVGNPKASRAVGLANGRNPIAVIVPCHRVIALERPARRLRGRTRSQDLAPRSRSRSPPRIEDRPACSETPTRAGPRSRVIIPSDGDGDHGGSGVPVSAIPDCRGRGRCGHGHGAPHGRTGRWLHGRERHRRSSAGWVPITGCSPTAPAGRIAAVSVFPAGRCHRHSPRPRGDPCRPSGPPAPGGGPHRNVDEDRSWSSGRPPEGWATRAVTAGQPDLRTRARWWSTDRPGRPWEA